MEGLGLEDLHMLFAKGCDTIFGLYKWLWMWRITFRLGTCLWWMNERIKVSKNARDISYCQPFEWLILVEQKLLVDPFVECWKSVFQVCQMQTWSTLASSQCCKILIIYFVLQITILKCDKQKSKNYNTQQSQIEQISLAFMANILETIYFTFI